MDPILISDGSWIGSQWTLFLTIGIVGAALVRWRWWMAWPVAAVWVAAVAAGIADLRSTGADDLAFHVVHGAAAAATGLVIPAVAAFLGRAHPHWLRLRDRSANETARRRPA